MPIPAEISTCHLPQGHFATSITAWRDCESPGKVVWVSIVKALDPGGLPGHFFPKAQRPEGQLDAENLHLLGRPRDCQLVRSTSCWPARPSGQWPPVAASGHVAHRIQCFNMLQLPCPASLFVPTSTANFCIEMISGCQLSNDFSALKSMVVHHPPWKASSVRTWTDSIAGSWRYAMTSDWGRVVPLQGSLEWVYYHHLHIYICIYICIYIYLFNMIIYYNGWLRWIIIYIHDIIW
jgi:hypothetical protein